MYTKDKVEGKSQSNQSTSATKFVPISVNFAKADVSSVAVVVFICVQAQTNPVGVKLFSYVNTFFCS